MSGWAGAGNVGDELLTRAMVQRLRSAGACPVIASRQPARTSALHGVESVPWGPRGWSTVASMDGVCLGPGGILQDSSSVWSLPGHLAVVLAARRRGIPIAAIGVGAEPLRRQSSRSLLRHALRDATVITRDEASTAALAAAGVTATTGADVVFGLDLPTVEPAAEILVSVGGAVGPGVVSPASRRIEAPPIDAIAGALDRLAVALGARVVLSRFRGARDADIANELAATLVTDAEVLADDVDEHVRRVMGARLVVGSRYHPIVLAARAGVPALVVSDQAKVRSLAQQLHDCGVRLVPSWDLVTASSVPLAPAVGTVLPGVTTAHESIEALVVAAGAARGNRRRG